MKKLILIPHIKVHNANALSSPYTIGFPAMTAWMGFTHALQRKLANYPDKKEDFQGLHFSSMAVVCHNIDLQTYKGKNDYVHSIIGTGNPLDKHGNRSSFIEEARCHLVVSLVIEYNCNYPEELTNTIDKLLQGNMKIAGGDILSARPSKTFTINSENKQYELINHLMPGFCLIERQDLMTKAMENSQDAIDALLDYIAIHHQCEVDDNENVNWISKRKEKGWIVPIAIGFQGVSDLGIAENQRDQETHHRFAESVVTLGEFIMPYRITDLEQMLWHYQTDLDNNLYLCKQNQPYSIQQGE